MTADPRDTARQWLAERDMGAKRRGNASKRDQRHPSARLTDAEVVKIRFLAAQGLRHRDIANQFGISLSHTGSLISGRSRPA
jgi:hypothetical protein